MTAKNLKPQVLKKLLGHSYSSPDNTCDVGERKIHKYIFLRGDSTDCEHIAMFFSFGTLVLLFSACVRGQKLIATSTRPARSKPIWCALDTDVLFEPTGTILQMAERTKLVMDEPLEITLTWPSSLREDCKKPQNAQEYYSRLEARFQSIAREGSLVLESNLAGIKAAQNLEEQKLAAINAQAAADFDRELTVDEWPKAFLKNLSPLEKLHRLAVTELHCRDDDRASRIGEKWLSWYRNWNSDLPYDTRTTAEKLVAYTRARKSGKIPSNPEIEEFEKQFFDMFSRWYRDNTPVPSGDKLI